VSLEFRDEAYDGPSAQQLIDALQAEYVVRYGGPDETPVDPAEFAPPDGRFVIGYLDGVPVATGGLRRRSARDVEIKRMYVVPESRGRGLSREMLAALEARACDMGAERVVLETGERQPEAIRLYETSGYEPTERFGYYADAPMSRYYAKDLGVVEELRRFSG